MLKLLRTKPLFTSTEYHWTALLSAVAKIVVTSSQTTIVKTDEDERKRETAHAQSYTKRAVLERRT